METMRDMIVIFLLGLAVSVQAQEKSFKVTTTFDTVLLGNYLEIKFTAVNVRGKFTEPSLGGFRLISGPSTFSSMTVINGESSSTTSYTYFVKPEQTGEYAIGPATLETADGRLMTDAKKIIVLPNPGEVIQAPDSRQDNSFDILVKPSHRKPAPPKKTYKL